MVTAAVVCSVIAPFCGAQERKGPQPAPELLLTEQIELARLVDIAAQRLKVNIEYDAALVKGAVTLRLGAGISDAELWDLTNRILAARGFTTVRPPGRDGVLSVVKLDAAAGLTRINSGNAAPAAPEAGFSSVAYRLKHRSAKELTETLKQVLSKPAGSVGSLGDDVLLITDLTPRVEQTLRLLETLDVPGEPIEVIEVPAVNLGAQQLVALALQVTIKRDAVAGSKEKGEVLMGPDGKGVLVIAPKSAQEFWRGLLTALDKREPVSTVTYTPRYFDLKEVQRLLDQSIKPAGAGEDRWRIVVDDLSGSLIITASASQHEQVAALLTRLNSVPPEGRRPMRIFKIRNRGVNEVLSVLENLVSSGELAGDLPEGAAPLPPAPQTIPPGTSTPLAASPGSATGIRTDVPFRADAPAGSPTSQVLPGGTTPTRRDALIRPGHGQASASRAGGGTPADVLLTSDEGTSSIIAVGEPRLLSQLERIIQQLDVRQPQVMVQALVVSLSDSQARQLGIELEGQLNLSGASLMRLSSLFGLSTAGDQVGVRTSTGTGGTGLLLSPGEFAVVVRALESLNQGRSVSMPQILVGNNQQAVFNSVVQQPFQATTTSNNVTSNVLGGSSSAGTVVTAKPQISEGDYLVLEYSVELSAFVGQPASQFVPPPKQTNNVSSRVTLPDGFTVAVGALDLTTTGNSEERVPFLGSIPILGEAFKSRSYSPSHNRFYIFVRAEVMRYNNFEDLKYISEQQAISAGVPDGWPEVEPRIIK